MNDFNDITLLPAEYRLLKKCNKHNGFMTSDKLVKHIRLKNLVRPENLSDLADPEHVCNFHTTDKGQRYIVWYRRHFIKSYYPIAISFVALGVSAIHVLLEICGII